MIDQETALEAIKLALEMGATDAECSIAEGDELSAGARMRSLETVKEAGSRAAGLRVLVGQRAGSSYTSDLSREGIRRMVASALEVAAVATSDPHAGLPEASELGSIAGDLGLYSDTVPALETDFKIQQALDTEEASLAT